MLWIKAFHIIAMVTWFSGLFYLPRLFVYHAQASDAISISRFKVMEKKLYYFITTPSALLTILFGIWLVSFNAQAYLKMGWLHAKLGCVVLLLIYHHYLGHCLKSFTQDRNMHSAFFYRVLNEIPVLFLVSIVLLAVLKP